MKAPDKWKSIKDFTPDDHYRQLRGERVMSDAYVEYRNDALKAAGLDDELTPEAGTKSVEEMSPEDHLADIQGTRS